ncbi:MAG: tetratricopeptide repeat protein [bacterium]
MSGARLAGAARTASLLIFAAACFVAQGCASTGGVEIVEARTGEEVVRVRSSCSFDELAKEVWGDERRGQELAVLAHLPYDRPVPRGTVLVLPSTTGPAPTAANARQADARFRDGLAAAKSGAYSRAAAQFREALALDPGRIEVRFNLGLALLEIGELSESTTILEEVARLRPKHAESRYALGAVLRKRRAYQRALEEFEATLEIEPGHRNAAFARARTLEDLGAIDRAEDAWKRFLDRFPHDPLAKEASRRLAALKAGKAVEPDGWERTAP